MADWKLFSYCFQSELVNTPITIGKHLYARLSSGLPTFNVNEASHLIQSDE
ncbi:Uncharacterized protein DAT39_020515 [Clarias magur]|uniref:Uncharacterized protein n=1 Tax=Clarias magur TaxID=1594786 RepID=A0A8J4TB87_CLAMG|nr:Uncharacterized protein DAT39_020515 [Clarias magur]